MNSRLFNKPIVKGCGLTVGPSCAFVSSGVWLLTHPLPAESLEQEKTRILLSLLFGTISVSKTTKHDSCTARYSFKLKWNLWKVIESDIFGITAEAGELSPCASD
ncbi:unnamed protein product [Protopolystoma xenopodis]|uniref:Uncharacterized protein n=1 Tax=Protopolystoma xenopodis TaxID=117903 RepID=A0A448WPV2_9PLAT|nr:unnamed protein product [Protopolystoma xenopodis]